MSEPEPAASACAAGKWERQVLCPRWPGSGRHVLLGVPAAAGGLLPRRGESGTAALCCRRCPGRVRMHGVASTAGVSVRDPPFRPSPRASRRPTPPLSARPEQLATVPCRAALGVAKAAALVLASHLADEPGLVGRPRWLSALHSWSFIFIL